MTKSPPPKNNKQPVLLITCLCWYASVP